MVFELDKFYKHTNGRFMHMIAMAEKPIMWFGPTLIAESLDGSLTPCGGDETSSSNWSEVTEKEYRGELGE